MPVSRFDPATGASAAGPRSPESDSSTAGMPRAPNGACWPRVNGNARCTNWPPSPVKPAVSGVWALRAAARVLRRTGGATDARLDQGMTTGCLMRVLPTSPRTSTASTGPARVDASRMDPAVPAEPLVEASTTVRLSVSPLRSRASSISMAVPEAAARAPAPSASRGASTMMEPAWDPGQTPTTFSSVWVPSTVRALNVSVVGFR